MTYADSDATQTCGLVSSVLGEERNTSHIGPPETSGVNQFNIGQQKNKGTDIQFPRRNALISPLNEERSDHEQYEKQVLLLPVCLQSDNK